MAVMRKNGERDANDTPRKDKKAKKDKQRNSKKETASCNRDWIKDPDRFDFVTSDNITAAIPKAWRDVYDAAAKSLKILSAGITIGESKGKDIIPAQALDPVEGTQQRHFCAGRTQLRTGHELSAQRGCNLTGRHAARLRAGRVQRRAARV